MARWEPMLERVARERYPRLVACAMLLTGSRADAEDLVQDALVATFSGRARFATLPQAEAYLRRALVSRYVDAGRRATAERRKASRVAALSRPGAGQAHDDGHDDGHGDGLRPELVDALAGLAPRERACVVLRHMEGLSTRETASALSISEGAVKRYLSDGLAALTAALGPGVGVDADERAPVVTVPRVDPDADARPAVRAPGGEEGSGA